MSDDLDPDGLLGGPELAARLGIGKSTARKLLRDWLDNSGTGPTVTTRSTRHFVRVSDLVQWKSEQERVGAPLPGHRRPGRKRLRPPTDSKPQ